MVLINNGYIVNPVNGFRKSLFYNEKVNILPDIKHFSGGVHKKRPAVAGLFRMVRKQQ
jgi:hypothetical protein